MRHLILLDYLFTSPETSRFLAVSKVNTSKI